MMFLSCCVGSIWGNNVNHAAQARRAKILGIVDLRHKFSFVCSANNLLSFAMDFNTILPIILAIAYFAVYHFMLCCVPTHP